MAKNKTFDWKLYDEEIEKGIPHLKARDIAWGISKKSAKTKEKK